MKNYTITVNGVAYEVTVEENTNNSVNIGTKASNNKPVMPKVQKKVSNTDNNDGAIKIDSPMPGKIINIRTQVGSNVKKGDVILLLEAMKMENEIVAPQDGTVASINVSVGEEVEAGAVLATLN